MFDLFHILLSVGTGAAAKYLWENGITVFRTRDVISKLLGDADVFTAVYTPRERDRFEGKIRAVVQSLIDNGIDVKVYLE